MKTKYHITFGLIALATLPGAVPLTFAAGDGAVSSAITSTPASSTTNMHIRDIVNKKTGDQRQSLIKEAIAANDKMVEAIYFLNKKNTRQAIKLLEEADGELNVVMARAPSLKMAAIAVRTNINDLEATSDTIGKSVKDAKVALDAGQVQAARADLAMLTSEMHIATDYVPLELYPVAIKNASKEIQASRINEAEVTLINALNSIVTIEDVIPLPPLKAEGDVLEADVLLKKDKVNNKDQALILLGDAEQHLANAAALGYGKNQDIRNELAFVKSRVAAKTATADTFDRIKNLFHGLMPGKKG